MHFIQTLLDPSVTVNAGNSASVALALRVLASLVTVEPDFSTFEESKVGRRQQCEDHGELLEVLSLYFQHYRGETKTKK